ncbi:MAG: hypothetical protein D6780_08110 [Candidatus Dadabacteria bacterium]|nr:MAG: hypothetical protein D6780_08110 [Candidatus Dadabacteria bacterium]
MRSHKKLSPLFKSRRLLIALTFYLLFSSYAQAALKGIKLNDDLIQSTKGVTCGYIGKRWQPGKVKKGKFYSYAKKIKFLQKRAKKIKSTDKRRKLLNKAFKLKLAQKRRKKKCKKLSMPGSKLIENYDWRAISNSREILAGINSDSTGNVLTIVNNSSDTLEAPSLVGYNPTTGNSFSIAVSDSSSISAGKISTFNINFPGGEEPADNTVINLLFGGEQAAVFYPAENYATLSPAFTTPKKARQAAVAFNTSLTPGTWNFTMHLNSSYLSGTNCPTSSGGGDTSGEAKFYVSNDGYSAMWIIDGEVVTFSRSAASSNFESPLYTFPVELDDGTSYGLNRWKLTPASQTQITGILDWNNYQGCTAKYPIEMNFSSLGTPGVFSLCEGLWTMDMSTLVCVPSGSAPPTTINTNTLSNFPPFSGNLDVVYADDMPLFLNYGNLSSYSSLYNISGTNMYGNPFANMFLGTVTDSTGAPLVITGGVQMTAQSNQLITGTVTINGSGLNPCFGTATFTMSYAGSSC